METKRNDVLVVEISGKRPGNKNARPTEKFNISYPHIIVSNDSEGYVTDWEIVNVPQNYKDWYIENVKQSTSAWYAPMNRSYAIKYARENGYKYLVQLDDNISGIGIAFTTTSRTQKTYRVTGAYLMNDFINALICVLDNSSAAQAGLQLMSVTPTNQILSERYCYSFFALNLSKCPSLFQGDFEDDIEYRLKQRQMNFASLCIAPFVYNKTSQGNNKDLSGCRKAYAEAGLKRGENMRKLYGDIYTCGLSEKRISTNGESEEGTTYFKHKIKPFKVGVTINRAPIDECIRDIIKKYAQPQKERHYLRKHKVKATNGKG